MTEKPSKGVPGTVVALGSLWLLAAAGLLLWSLSLLFLIGVLRNFTPGGMDPLPPAPPVMQPLYWAFEHYALSGSILGALALLGLYSGVQFLRLKPWARTFFEAGSWTAIALSFVLGFWWTQLWVASTPQDETGLGDGVMYWVTVVIGSLMGTLFYATIPIVFVCLLRSRLVRPAFSSGAPSPSQAAAEAQPG